MKTLSSLRSFWARVMLPKCKCDSTSPTVIFESNGWSTWCSWCAGRRT